MNVFSMLNLLFLCRNKMATTINNIFVTTQSNVCHKNNIFLYLKYKIISKIAAYYNKMYICPINHFLT